MVIFRQKRAQAAHQAYGRMPVIRGLSQLQQSLRDVDQLNLHDDYMALAALSHSLAVVPDDTPRVGTG